MKNLAILNNMSRTFSRVNFQLKKHSPEIMVIAGVVGVVTSAVMACKATTKVNDILEETKEKASQVHEVLADESISKEKYSEEDGKKDLAIIYTQAGVKFIKLYGPSIALGALSIASILTSHHIMHKRNIALAAAYTAIDTSFKGYRNRVIERFGEELDKELRYNIKAKEIEETTKNAKGKEKTVKKSIEVADVNEYSDYARFFDELCTGWKRDAEYNLMFLKHQQNYANEKLQKQGYLFLNDVYDMLGIPKTKAGQIVGWIYDESHPDIYDNFVDFGIYDLYNEKARDFVNGREKSILLDFNVDGNILDLI